PCAPINSPAEFVAEEQTRLRGYFQRTGFPHIGEAPFAPAPFHLSATPAVLRRPAPSLGQNDEGWTTTEGAVREPLLQKAGHDGPPLAGRRVVDLGVGAVGPEIGWVLAELGAEVNKIES